MEVVVAGASAFSSRPFLPSSSPSCSSQNDVRRLNVQTDSRAAGSAAAGLLDEAELLYAVIVFGALLLALALVRRGPALDRGSLFAAQD